MLNRPIEPAALVQVLDTGSENMLRAFFGESF
jgi:hypothetical protein